MTTSTGETTAEVREPTNRGAIPADTFAIRLMLVRVHAGDLTQMQAAERTGLNYGSWSNWENGRQPRDKADVVQVISETFGIDRDWLMYGGALAPEPRRHARGGDLVGRAKGLSFRPGDVTARSVQVRTVTGGHNRRPRDGRPAGRPDEFTRPARLTGPITR